MIENKMVMQSASISGTPPRGKFVFQTKGSSATVITIETSCKQDMVRLLEYDAVFVTVADADEIRCTCIASRDDLVDPNCPIHGD